MDLVESVYNIKKKQFKRSEGKGGGALDPPLKNIPKHYTPTLKNLSLIENLLRN